MAEGVVTNTISDEPLPKTRCMTLINFDKLMESNPHAKPINNGTLCTKNMSSIADAVYDKNEERPNFVPVCSCGHYRGKSKEGLTCPNCGTVCSYQMVDSLDHEFWICLPEDFPPFIHPVWYNILYDWTLVHHNDGVRRRKNLISTIDIILNPRYHMPQDLAPYISDRGFKYFYENCDRILDILEFEYQPTSSRAKNYNIRSMRQLYRDCIFAHNFPILHNSLHPLKRSGDSRFYSDKSSSYVLSAAIDLDNLIFLINHNDISKRRAKNGLFKIYKNLIEYYTSFVNGETGKLGGKNGIIRKHNFGSRFNFSFRTVVVPHDKILPLDEVILPWGIMVNNLKLMILNYLTNKYHKTMDEALAIHNRALTNYDATIDNILTQIIHNFPNHKIPILMGRNPTLAYGSIMLLFVKEYRKDPHDQTLAINACIVKPANIDFDGDELYGLFIFENRLAEKLKSIHPSQFLLDVTSLGISSRIGILAQNCVVLMEYFNDDPDTSYYEELE